jgi:YYY domain-containing protein
VDSISLFYIAPWLVFFWLLGWVLLPISRRLLGALPDGGLAAGRVLFLVLLGTVLYWGAFWHLLSLRWAPYFFWLLPLGALWPLHTKSVRQEFKGWLKTHRGALLFSDAVFVAAFGFFVWVRARHPELNDLEKLMDSALLSALARTEWLPVENPWFSGSFLTSYYHFGPFLGALPVRAFETPLPIAYNLVQPIFAALFLSVLWSLGAALAGSARRGLIVVVLVALLGHFEPIRQWKNPLPHADINFARLDWWSTSRVLPDIEPEKGADGKEKLPSPLEYSRLWKELAKAPWTTNIDHRWFAISEYPAFTLFTGDLHAHFYALPLSALFFCLCFVLFGARRRRRWLLLVLLGLVLGVFAMTNTWDVPLYALLGLSCALFSALPWAIKYPVRLAQAWIFLPLIPLTALPYLLRFKPQVSGVKFEIWPPAPLPFVLLWGGWLALWFVCVLPYVPRETSGEVSSRSRKIWLTATLGFVVLGALLPVTTLVLGALALTAYALFVRKKEAVVPRQFILLLGFVGLLSVLVPQIGYVQGFFGGGLRHQDTVFKFGLQGWLMLGTAASAGALRYIGQSKPLVKWRNLGLLGTACIVPALCALCVLWTRVVRDAPRDEKGQFLLSLDGARWVPPSDRAAMDWLLLMSRPGDRVLESVGENERGGLGGDFSNNGRVSAFTGLATPLGWPQHVWMWGEDISRVAQRWETVRRIYQWPRDGSAEVLLRELKVQWVFIGAEERNRYEAAGLRRLQNALTPVYTNGDTVILKVDLQ